MKTKFPLVSAAIEALEQDKRNLDGKRLWAIGDALIRECGPGKATRGVLGHDGSHLKLKAIAREQAGFGREYSFKTLGQWRQIAEAFPTSRRHHDVLWSLHRMAGSPDFLDWIVEECGTDITYRDVEKVRKRWMQLEKKQRKHKLDEAREEARQAPTPKAKEAAEEKVKEFTDVPDRAKRDLPAPNRENQAELRAMAAILDVEADAKVMVKDLRNHLSTIDKMRDEINVEFIDSLVETYQAVSEVATQIADRLGKTRLKRFSTIKGGKAS